MGVRIELGNYRRRYFWANTIPDCFIKSKLRMWTPTWPNPDKKLNIPSPHWDSTLNQRNPADLRWSKTLLPCNCVLGLSLPLQNLEGLGNGDVVVYSVGFNVSVVKDLRKKGVLIAFESGESPVHMPSLSRDQLEQVIQIVNRLLSSRKMGIVI